MKLPSYNIPRILKLRKKIVEGISLEYHGYAHDAEAFDSLVNRVSSLLPKVDRDVVWDSIRTYAGVAILNTQLHELSWRLAGNISRLQDGVTVPLWSSFSEQEWVPVQVQSVQRFRVAKKKQKEIVGQKETEKKPIQTRSVMIAKIMVLAGLPAGHTFEKFMTEPACYFIRTDLGFSQYAATPSDMFAEPKKSYPMSDVTELTRMRFMALLTADSCKDGLNCNKIACTGSMKKWNRLIMQKRQREGFSCPFSYPLATHPCHLCEKGYVSCPASCHHLDYHRKMCVKCNNPKAFFDPEQPGSVCVDCLSRQLVKRGT